VGRWVPHRSEFRAWLTRLCERTHSGSYDPRVRDEAQSELFTRELYSAALGRNVRYGAYVPQREPDARCPVLLLLHGADGAYTDFCDHAHAQLLQLSAAHGLILVLPEGAKDGWWVDGPLVPQHRYATHLLSEVLPDSALWLPANERRSIAGISAGGNAAIVSALTHPGLFSSVSSLSGALDLEWARNRPALQRALGAYDDDPALWQRWSARHVLQRQRDTAHTFPLLLTVGASDLWAESNRVFSAELQALQIPHTFRELPGGHDWQHWVSLLPEHIAFHAHALHVSAMQ
jgi:putative tributyrin esterase